MGICCCSGFKYFFFFFHNPNFLWITLRHSDEIFQNIPFHESSVFLFKKQSKIEDNFFKKLHIVTISADLNSSVIVWEIFKRRPKNEFITKISTAQAKGNVTQRVGLIPLSSLNFSETIHKQQSSSQFSCDSIRRHYRFQVSLPWPTCHCDGIPIILLMKLHLRREHFICTALLKLPN